MATVELTDGSCVKSRRALFFRIFFPSRPARPPPGRPQQLTSPFSPSRKSSNKENETLNLVVYTVPYWAPHDAVLSPGVMYVTACKSICRCRLRYRGVVHTRCYSGADARIIYIYIRRRLIPIFVYYVLTYIHVTCVYRARSRAEIGKLEKNRSWKREKRQDVNAYI